MPFLSFLSFKMSKLDLGIPKTDFTRALSLRDYKAGAFALRSFKGRMQMKAMVFDEHGPVTNLHLVDLPLPVPDAGEVVVSVKAISLNGFDPMILAQIPGIKTPLPMIPGGDVAGTISNFGPETEASSLSIGDRVLVNPFLPGKGVLGETIRGGACEYITIPIENIVPLPDEVSFEDAAALPIAYGTAHRMMLERGKVKKGDKVLILGATGGVGVCCVQLAKLQGAEVAACTTSPAKAEMLKSIGVDHVINVAETDYFEAVRELWGKPRVFSESGGADIVVNFVGGDDWSKALRCTKRGGKILTCGATNGFNPQTDIRYIWSFELNIIGSNAWDNTDLSKLLNLVASGDISPVKSSVRPVEELAVSFQELIDRKVFGKAILTI